MGWNRQLSTYPSHIDFHFSNYCLKPIMNIGKFLNFFRDTYFGFFLSPLLTQKLKKKKKKKWGRVWRWPVCLWGETAGPDTGRPSGGRKCLVASFWTNKNATLHLWKQLCWNRWVEGNRVGDVSGRAIGARWTRRVARCDRLNIYASNLSKVTKVMSMQKVNGQDHRGQNKFCIQCHVTPAGIHTWLRNAQSLFVVVWEMCPIAFRSHPSNFKVV